MVAGQIDSGARAAQLGEVRYHKWFFDLSKEVNHNLAIGVYNDLPI